MPYTRAAPAERLMPSCTTLGYMKKRAARPLHQHLAESKKPMRKNKAIGDCRFLKAFFFPSYSIKRPHYHKEKFVLGKVN